MILVTFKSKKDKEHMLEKARKMQQYIDEYVECLEESVDEESNEYYERRGGSARMRSRYDRPTYRYEDEDLNYRRY